jgi:hypothetical protein
MTELHIFVQLERLALVWSVNFSVPKLIGRLDQYVHKTRLKLHFYELSDYTQVRNSWNFC